MPITAADLNLFAKNSIFIETGSYLGDGIQTALDVYFKRIISIEIDPKYVDHCRNRFKDNNNVEIIHGDSSVKLLEILNTLNEPATFWLDGHWFEGDLLSPLKSPLIQELAIIYNHNIKNHTILIDDIRCWREMDNYYHDGFNLQTIIEMLWLINPNYKLYRLNGLTENDILVAELI